MQISTSCIGVAGAVIVISLLLIITIIIGGYYYKVKKHSDPGLHIYDLPDVCNLRSRPHLPPRLNKLETDNRQFMWNEKIRDNFLKDNVSRLEKDSDEELDCEHAQPTHNNLKLQFSNCLEHALPTITMQSNSAYGVYTLNLVETLAQDLPSIPMLNVHSSEQTGIYEQIQGYERSEHGDTHILTCHSKQSLIAENANTCESHNNIETDLSRESTLFEMVRSACKHSSTADDVTNTALMSSDNIQPQHDLPDRAISCDQECGGCRLEIPPEAYQTDSEQNETPTVTINGSSYKTFKHYHSDLSITLTSAHTEYPIPVQWLNLFKMLMEQLRPVPAMPNPLNLFNQL